jgi:hypothetical protein
MNKQRAMNVSRHMCDCCGSHEVALDRLCHNSSCELHQVAVTVYEGGLPGQAPALTVAQMKADSARYRKLQRWMASNVPEGWAEVEKLAALAAYIAIDSMDQALDALPECNVGLCEVAPS